MPTISWASAEKSKHLGLGARPPRRRCSQPGELHRHRQLRTRVVRPTKDERGKIRVTVRTEILKVDGTQLETQLLPRLLGRVFHVTGPSAYQRILADGHIRSNQHGRFRFTFPQSEKSYARRHGYVAVFDLRDKPRAQVQWVLEFKFPFLKPGRGAPVFFMLGESACSRLIPPPSTSMAALNHEYIWIPEVEMFYPTDLPLTEIDTVIRTRLYYVPEPPEVVAAQQDALRMLEEIIARRQSEFEVHRRRPSRRKKSR